MFYWLLITQALKSEEDFLPKAGGWGRGSAFHISCRTKLPSG